MRTVLAAALLLLVPFMGHAQEPLPDLMADHGYFGPARYANAQDSAEFAQFRQGLSTDPDRPKWTPTCYRMVWREHQQGGSWSIARGEGTLTLSPNGHMSIHGSASRIPFRTADGQRGLMIGHERPCAMICRSVMYYVEVGP